MHTSRKFFVYHVTGSTSESFFELCISHRYIQNFERNWRNHVAWELTILMNLYKEKKKELSKLQYCTLCGKTWVGEGQQKVHPSHKSWTRYALAMKLFMRVMLHKIFQKIPNNQGYVIFLMTPSYFKTVI